MERDYNKYDYQTIVAKIEKANRLIEDYASFGWKKIEECPHSIYENLIEITFEREHKIANKDDMQFLQVNYEYYINQIGRLERKKHKKSVIFGISMILIISMLILFAVFAPIKLTGTLAIILCSVYSFFALLFIILTIIILNVLIEKEKNIYDSKSKEYEIASRQICEQAKKLSR